jgi:hypothetical protein
VRRTTQSPKGLVVADDRREQSVRLAAMVGLVVEEMIERRRQRLFDGLRGDYGAVADRATEGLVVEAIDITADEDVL